MRMILLFVSFLLAFGCGSRKSTSDTKDSRAETKVERVDATTVDQPEAETVGETRTETPGAEAEVVAPICPTAIADRPLVNEPDETFELGPYLMDVRPDSAVIMWRTIDPVPGTVHYGPGEDLSLVLAENGPARVHEIRVEGLVPDTRYAYRVEADGKSGEVHHFYTAPPLGTPVRFTLFGDNQNGPETFVQVVEAMIQEGPHFLVGVGDHVQEGKVPELWYSQLFQPARALLHQVPFYAALGNHEQNAQDWYDLVSYLPEPDPLDPDREAFYSYSYGNVFAMVINTNTIFFPVGDVDTPGSAWIREQVASPAAQAATWRIAYGHEPGISESWSPGNCDYDGNTTVRKFVMPLLVEHGFHVYFSGHTHAYERAQYESLVHIISGGGGGALDEWCVDQPETTIVYQNNHYLRIEAGCETFRAEAVNMEGEVFDWFELAVDQPGVLVDQGTGEGLPELIVNSASPTVD